MNSGPTIMGAVETAGTGSLPETVTIGTVTYRITQDPGEWQTIEHQTQTKGYYGHTQHTEATIYLNPNAAPTVTRLTLWHEIFHCIDETALGDPDWRALNGNPEDKAAAEETVIRMLEHPTLAVLRDNPDLVEYLVAG